MCNSGRQRRPSSVPWCFSRDWLRPIRAFAAIVLVVLAGVLTLAAPAFALQPDEILKDPELESRARALSAELRCVVCQNQSIDDSDAPLARDLRLLVRERLQAGDSNSEVMEFIVARYGEFVLLRPPIGAHTLLLWLAPAFILVFGVWLARRVLRNARSGPAIPQAAPLTEDEQKRLAKLLKDS